MLACPTVFALNTLSERIPLRKREIRDRNHSIRLGNGIPKPLKICPEKLNEDQNQDTAQEGQEG